MYIVSLCAGTRSICCCIHDRSTCHSGERSSTSHTSTPPPSLSFSRVPGGTDLSSMAPLTCSLTHLKCSCIFCLVQKIFHYRVQSMSTNNKHSSHSLTQSHSHSLSHSLSHTLIHSLTHSISHSFSTELILTLCSAVEFSQGEYIGVKSRPGDQDLSSLVKELPQVDIKNRQPPFCAPYAVKARLLLFASMKHIDLPNSDLVHGKKLLCSSHHYLSCLSDQDTIIKFTPVLITEMLKILTELWNFAKMSREQKMNSMTLLPSTALHCSLTHSSTHSSTHSLTHSSTHSLTHSSTHSLTHPLTHSFIHSLTHSLIHSLTHSLIHLLTHSSTHSFIHSLTHSSTHSPTHSSTHSLIHSLNHSLTHSSSHPLTLSLFRDP